MGSCHVPCPAELYSFTGIHRADEVVTSFACENTYTKFVPGMEFFGTFMNCGSTDDD